jgi:hypothetical protein
MSGHAKLSPSSAYRWFVCPGSVRETAHLPDDSNKYARLGTAAHTLGERCLKTGTDAEKWIGTQRGRIAVDYIENGEQKREFFLVDLEMAEAVQVYLDYVRPIASRQGARLLIEERVGLTKIAEALSGIWGTSDAVVYDSESKTLYVIDYKHGQGKVVDVENNLQLMIYALAAWATFNERFEVENVVCTIVQPRAGGEQIKSVTYAAIDLLDFVQDCLDAVARVEDPNAPLVPGDHCDFCKIRGSCAARRNLAITDAQDDFFAPTVGLDVVQTAQAVAEISGKVGPLIAWLKDAEEWLHAQAMKGETIPGKKLVAKRAERKWNVSDKEIVAALSPLVALDDELYVPRELLSPGHMEKVLGKGGKKLVDPLTTKVSSGYNLVDESDKRPAITVHPGDDFVELLGETDG